MLSTVGVWGSAVYVCERDGPSLSTRHCNLTKGLRATKLAISFTQAVHNVCTAADLYESVQLHLPARCCAQYAEWAAAAALHQHILLQVSFQEECIRQVHIRLHRVLKDTAG